MTCVWMSWLFLVVSSALAQNYVAIPKSFEKCQTSTGTYDVSLNQKGERFLAFSVDLDVTFKEDCTFNGSVYAKTADQYIKYMDMGGDICDVLTNGAPVAWDRLKSHLKPKVEESCNIRPGSYKLEEFKLSKDEFELPIPSKGEFRTDMSLNCANKEIACIIVEFDIIEDE